MTPGCQARNAAGEPCESPPALVDASGFCFAHRPGGAAHMATIAASGGAATAAKLAARPFTDAEVVPLTNAAGAAAQVHVAVMTGRITHAQGATALKAIEVQLKAEAAAREQLLVDEMLAKQATLERENRDLRQQVATLHREKRGAA